MSKRWLKGVGTGLHELGSSIEGRNAAADKRAFEERKAAIAHQRSIDLENLRQTHGMARLGKQHENDMTGRKFSADRADALGERRDRAATERADIAAGRAVALERQRFEHSMEVERFRQSAKEGDTVTTRDGRMWVKKNGELTPLMMPGETTPGIIPSEGDHPGRGGKAYTGIVAPEQARGETVAEKHAAKTAVPADVRKAEEIATRFGISFQQAWDKISTSKSNPTTNYLRAIESVLKQIEQGFLNIPYGDQQAFEAAVQRVLAAGGGGGGGGGGAPPPAARPQSGAGNDPLGLRQ